MRHTAVNTETAEEVKTDDKSTLTAAIEMASKATVTEAAVASPAPIAQKEEV